MAGAQQDPVAGMRAITISREYGSGGGEIAARLAARLGWHLIDHEVVVQVAQALGVTEAEAEAHDEHVDNLVSKLLFSLAVIQPPALPEQAVSLTDDSAVYDEARRRVVEAAVAAGRAIIVGRGGQVLLADRRDVLHVRIVAPLGQRIEYVMRRESLSRADAVSRINHKDRDRARFLSEMHHRNPSDAHLYDLVVNTGVIDLDSVVELLSLALERKARTLHLSTEEVGPAVGVAPYAEPPGNFGETPPGDGKKG